MNTEPPRRGGGIELLEVDGRFANGSGLSGLQNVSTEDTRLPTMFNSTLPNRAK